MRPRHLVYAAPVVLWVVAMIAAWASPAEFFCGTNACTNPQDATWVTYTAAILWALSFVALVPAALLAAYRGVRRFLALSRTPAVPPERHDVIS